MTSKGVGLRLFSSKRLFLSGSFSARFLIGWSLEGKHWFQSNSLNQMTMNLESMVIENDNNGVVFYPIYFKYFTTKTSRQCQFLRIHQLDFSILLVWDQSIEQSKNTNDTEELKEEKPDRILAYSELRRFDDRGGHTEKRSKNFGIGPTF